MTPIRRAVLASTAATVATVMVGSCSVEASLSTDGDGRVTGVSAVTLGASWPMAVRVGVEAAREFTARRIGSGLGSPRVRDLN